MIDWTNIKEKYSKAFDKMLEIMGWRWQDEAGLEGVCNTEEYGSFIHIRDLYDFFDDRGIAISIVWTVHPTEDRLEYYYDFAVNNIAAFESKEHYKTRTEAEEKAFEQSFKILENNLEKEK